MAISLCLCFAMSGTDLAMSGTDMGYTAIVLRLCYAMSGTELGYGALRGETSTQHSIASCTPQRRA
eukprot:1011114-Rhodomonas_salina.1